MKLKVKTVYFKDGGITNYCSINNKQEIENNDLILDESDSIERVEESVYASVVDFLENSVEFESNNFDESERLAFTLEVLNNLEI